MMHGHEKSDLVIVAMKPANKAKEAHCGGSRRTFWPTELTPWRQQELSRCREFSTGFLMSEDRLRSAPSRLERPRRELDQAKRGHRCPSKSGGEGEVPVKARFLTDVADPRYHRWRNFLLREKFSCTRELCQPSPDLNAGVFADGVHNYG
jgi:hypothetical protein